MMPPFAETLSSLEPDAISEVVESAFGFHVIRLDERMLADPAEVGSERERAEAIVRSQKLAAAIASRARELEAEAEIVSTQVSDRPGSDD